MFVDSKRDKFDEYEAQAIVLAETSEYLQVRGRKRNVRLNPLDYEKSPETVLSTRQKFMVDNFIPVIDQLSMALNDRISAYNLMSERFGFLSQIDAMTPDELAAAASKIISLYKNDVDSNLSNELVQFSEVIKIYKNDYDAKMPNELIFYQILMNNQFKSTFPNVEIVLRIYLVLMASNCSGERSFSKLKLVKNRLRTTMNQDRLSNLIRMSIESDILRELNTEAIIDKFVQQKSRKVHIV